MFFRMVYKSGQIFLPFCHNARVWRTDGRTEFSSLYRVCIVCSAVKSRILGVKLAPSNQKFCVRPWSYRSWKYSVRPRWISLSVVVLSLMPC